MLFKALPVAVAALLAVPIVTTHAGGWAVTTVEDLPHQFAAGKPTTLTYSVRQHGRHLVSGLQGHLTATSGDRQIDAAAVATSKTGYYTATLTLPTTGEWTITIDSGFGPGLRLLPVRAVTVIDQAAPPITADRGQQLFIAKGCNTCHYHGATKQRTTATFGADLTDKRYSDALLAKILQDPSIVQPTGIWTMPNLNLSQQEIAALVAFINKPRATN